MHAAVPQGRGWVCTTAHFGRIRRSPPLQINNLRKKDLWARYRIREVGLAHSFMHAKSSFPSLAFVPRPFVTMTRCNFRTPDAVENRWSPIAEGRPTFLPLPGG